MDLDDEETRAKLLAELLHDALEGPTSRIAKLNPKLLAAREMPPGNWQQLYLLYVASCQANTTEAACRATFYTATTSWRKTLKFRPKSQHSICGICDKLKTKMRSAKNFQAHARCADDLLGHLTMTWRCRQTYWAAREASRAKQDTLCIIYDGYDKSKAMLPRWAHGRLPKIPVFERFVRPHISVSATLAHGWGCVVFIAEEGVSTGGSFSWEAVFITISLCWEAARQRGLSWPSSFLGKIFLDLMSLSHAVLRLWLQHDNTVKELKNALSGCLLSYLCSGGYFWETCQACLPVGHTHEDIGACLQYAVLFAFIFSSDRQALWVWQPLRWCIWNNNVPFDVCRVAIANTIWFQKALLSLQCARLEKSCSCNPFF